MQVTSNGDALIRVGTNKKLEDVWLHFSRLKAKIISLDVRFSKGKKNMTSNIQIF